MTPSELRKMRKQAKLTQAKAAELMGVSERTIRRWEGGVQAIPQMAAELFTIKTEQEIIKCSCS